MNNTMKQSALNTVANDKKSTVKAVTMREQLKQAMMMRLQSKPMVMMNCFG